MDKRQWLEDKVGTLTHEQAAELVGIERSTLTKAINGYPISIRTAKRIGHAFHFDWRIFFDHESEESEHDHTA